MEKQPRSKGATIMLKYLQKAATFTITNTPHSPRGERLHATRGLSGPIASIIPTEARHKKRNDDPFDEEPTSPKVTCIGQIKHRKTTKERNKKKIPSALTRMLSQRVRPDHKEPEVIEKKKKTKKEKEMKRGMDTETATGAAPAPALGQMKKFASRRDSLGDFDWEKAASAAAEEEDVVNIYHSAPLVLGGGGGEVMAAEHKEIGLWRRRSMAALMPLEVNK